MQLKDPQSMVADGKRDNCQPEQRDTTTCKYKGESDTVNTIHESANGACLFDLALFSSIRVPLLARERCAHSSNATRLAGERARS
jgi:hypothetical protein